LLPCSSRSPLVSSYLDHLTAVLSYTAEFRFVCGIPVGIVAGA
jgi:hypothetical protein